MAKGRPFLGLQEELQTMRDHLRQADRDDRKYTRFFSLRHLYNLPADTVRAQGLRLYQAALAKLLNSLKERFLKALDQATGKFLKVGPDAGKDIRDFPESISAIARWYIHQELTAVEATRELGLKDAKELQGAIKANPRLQELGLFALANTGTVQREVWESLDFLTSPYQDAARELKLGTPVLFN